MKRIQKILLIDYVIPIAIAALIAILGETHAVDFDSINAGTQAEFYLLTIMEIATIAVIPLALRLFRFGRVKRALNQNPEEALIRWGLYRIDMLGIPMCINTALCYIYAQSAFGYLALILFLSLFFVYPSTQRCNEEIAEAQGKGDSAKE